MMKHKPLSKIKLSTKMKLDVASMEYFIPSGSKRRIYPNDRKKIALLSAQGIKPVVETPGYKLLKWGKTYRDEQITSYIRDVREGLFTKDELIQSMPHKLRPWLQSKLAGVPYNEDAYKNIGTHDRPYYVSTGHGTLPFTMSLYNRIISKK